MSFLSGKFRTIYIGGGTPTILNTKLLNKLLKGMQKFIGKASEFTIEANPESLNREKLTLFLDNGVNRLSIGAQSFNDIKLKRLGRIHDGRSASRAVAEASKKGFKNISIDMIFGVRAERISDWKKDLEIASGLPVKHISCYCLDCKKMEQGEEKEVRFYEWTIGRLYEKGFKQYEISNFAKAGYECRHNLNYWDNGPYTGLGPSAVSYIDGKREENIADVAGYIKRAGAKEPVTVSSEGLDRISRAKETAALKIRTMEGIDFGWFKKKTGFDFIRLEKDALPKLLEEGLIEYIKGKYYFRGVSLSHKGILFCDIVSCAFL